MIYTEEERSNIRELNCMKKFTINNVILHTSNSLMHEMAKAKICYYLKKEKRNFICEATFANGCRADIFDITWGIAYEITYRESRTSIELKKTKYPTQLIALQASQIWKCSLENLSDYLN